MGLLIIDWLLITDCLHLFLQLQRSKEGKDWWSYLAPKLTSEQLEGNIVCSFYYSPIHSLLTFLISC